MGFTRAGPGIATYGYASPEIPGKGKGGPLNYTGANPHINCTTPRTATSGRPLTRESVSRPTTACASVPRGTRRHPEFRRLPS
jgi:hypothetical protein